MGRIKVDQWSWSDAITSLTPDSEKIWILFLIVAAAAISFLGPAFRKRSQTYRKNVKNERLLASHTVRPAWDRTPSQTTLSHPPMTDVSDPKNQMDAVAHVDFEITPLLNREEARLLPLLESCARQVGKGHRVMAQTSMGEIIRPRQVGTSQEQRSAAYASINSKRLDFAIFDRFGRLALAIEYQGSGHYQAKSFMRDAVKREVLRKAGVQYLEVYQNSTHDDLSRQIIAIIGPIASQGQLSGDPQSTT